MKGHVLFLAIVFLFSCTPENELPDLKATQALEQREEPDCANFCGLEDPSVCLTDFSDCSSLAGSRAFVAELGPPPVTLTGQKGSGPGVPPVLDFCVPPENHPYIFYLKAGFDGSRAVERFPHIGRVNRVSFEVCFRPFILPSFDPFPFPQPFPYELYPPGNEFSGDWEIEAANGDLFQFQINATFYPQCDNPELYDMRGEWIVTGGTGRFADASGGGCISGTGWSNFLDPQPGALDQWLLEGGIDY